MHIKNLKIGIRLGAGFAVVLALMVSVAVLGISRMVAIEDNMEDIARVNDVEAQLLVAMRDAVLDRAIAVRNVVLLTEAAEMKPEAERLAQQGEKYLAAEAKLNKMFASMADTTPHEKEAMLKIKAAERSALPLIDKVRELGLANKNDEAVKVLMKEVRPAQRVWLDELSNLVAFESKLNEDALSTAEQVFASARMLMLTLTGVAIVLGSVIAWLITQGITGPLNKAVGIARTVASGDLSGRIEIDRSDETGQLLQALKDMNDSLVRIIGQVRSSTDTMATASGQIAAGNLDLSSRTEQQASSLEETAS